MANEQNLIDISKRPAREFKELSAKGGRANLGMPRYSVTKCKNCRLDACPLKEQGIKEDWKCQIHDLQRKVIEAIIDPEKLTESLIGDAFELQARAGTDFHKIRDSFYAKLNLKKEINPAIQRTENINKSVDLNKLLEAMKKDGMERTNSDMAKRERRQEPVQIPIQREPDNKPRSDSQGSSV
jgi:hypothetical protein